jgi:hypothetical protein
MRGVGHFYLIGAGVMVNERLVPESDSAFEITAKKRR